MSQAAVISAVLTLERSNFRTEQEKTTQELGRLRTSFHEAGGAVTVLERQLASDKGNQALQTQLKTAQQELRALGREMKVVESQKKNLDAALASGPKTEGPKLPDDSAAYEAHWKRIEEKQRSARAHEAMASVATPERLTMPERSSARAEINRQSGVPVWDTGRVGNTRDGHQSSGGMGRMGQMEAGHSVRAIFGSLGAGQGLGQAFQMELPRLLQASGKGLGGMIAIEGIASAIKGVETMVQRAREFRKEMAEALGGGGGGAGTKSQSAIQAQMESIAGLRDKLNTGGNADGTDRSLLQAAGSWMADTWKKVRGQKTGAEEKDDQIEELERRRIQLSEELAHRKAEQVALDKRAAIEGEAAVAIDKERLALKERIAAVVDDKNLDGHAQAEIIASLREESRLRQEHIRLAHELKAADDDLRHYTAEHRAAGETDPAIAAQEALTAAKKKRDAMLEGKYGNQRDKVMESPEYKAADDEVTNRDTDLRTAKTTRAQKRADNMRDADAQGSVGNKTNREIERDRLKSEQADLQRQIFDDQAPDYERDEEKRKALAARHTQNASALKRLDRDDTQRAFYRRREDVAAETGTGPQEKLRSINKLLEINSEEQQDNANNEHDGDRTSHLKAEAADLLKQKKEIEYASERELAAMQATTQEMAQQVSGHQIEAQLTSIRAQYEERIAGYLREGKNELAQQAGIQRDMAIEAAKLANFRRGPAGERQDRLRAQANVRDTKAMHAKEARDVAARRSRYEDDHRATLPLNPAARARAIAIGSGTAEPDRRGVANADPQKSAGDKGGKNDSGERTVSKLDEIKGLLQKNLTIG